MKDFILAQLKDGPQQVRTRERLELTIAAAEALLLESGPEQVSIPEVEKRSGVPRAAIYRYFPDKHVLFSTIAAGYMDLLGNALAASGPLPDSPWQEVLARAVHGSAEFYNAHPVASILIFNGPYTAQDRSAHTRKAALLVGALQERLPADFGEEDLALTIEIAFACFRYGYFRDGRISDEIIGAATRAATAFLAAAHSDPA